MTQEEGESQILEAISLNLATLFSVGGWVINSSTNDPPLNGLTIYSEDNAGLEEDESIGYRLAE